MNLEFLAAQVGVGISGLACAVAALAQAPVANGPLVCSPIPYAIGEKLKGGEIAARFSAGAVGRLAKLPNLTGRTGVEVVRTAYAGMNGQAMSAVFAAFGCQIKAYIKDTDVDADKKRLAVDSALALLDLEIGTIQNAAVDSPAALAGLKKEYYALVTRSADAPAVDSAIVKAALQPFNPSELFIDKRTIKYWGGLDFGSNISIQACGGVVKAAISDGGSALQASLARTKEILTNYLDPKMPPVTALGSLYLAVSSLPPISKDTQAAADTFKDCTKELATATSVIPASVSDPAADSASAPATSATPTAANSPTSPASAP